MCRLLLVRHGQASFGQVDYDQLSTIGRLQAESLGSYLANAEPNLALIAHGSLNRQIDTASLIQAQLKSVVKRVEYKWLNELDSTALFARYLPDVIAEHPTQFFGDKEEIQNAEISPHSVLNLSNFSFIFTQLVLRWADDKNCLIESFENFKGRVKSGVLALSKQHTAKDTLLLATSGGVIATLIQQAMSHSIEEMIDTALSLNNIGITEIEIAKGQLDLKTINSMAAIEALNKRELYTRL